jgi:phosphatidylglycerophosphate synthase
MTPTDPEIAIIRRQKKPPPPPQRQISDRVFTWANILTFMRIGLIPFFAIALVYEHFGWALILFAIAGVLIVLICAYFPIDNGLFLPATYAVVTAFAVASGIHYIYHVAKLMRGATESSSIKT